jgi:hypothetical protein
MKSIWWISFAAVITLTGCGNSDEPGPDAGATPEQAVPRDGGNGLLAGVDADTAYLYANLARMPEAILDKYWAINEASSVSNEAMLEALAEDEELPAAARALVTEALGLSSRAGWEAAGFHANPYYAIYGVDLLPFAQIELADRAAFSAMITRVESGLEQPMERRDIDGVEVSWIEIEPGFGVAMAWDDDSLTVGVIPDDAAMLARVAGHYSPPDSFRPDSLNGFNRELGFTSYGSGFLDWQRVVATMISDQSPIARIGGAEAAEAIRSDAACVSEFQALAAKLPRMVFGYTQMNENRADMMLRQEMAPELAAAIAPIARSPVSIDRELRGLVNFGLAFDLLAAREFARSLVSGWIESPPACSAFEAIAQGAPQWQESLARPIPPVITNLQGAFMELSRLETDGALPTGGGTLSFYMRNPQVLVGMAQMFAPALAEMPMEPGDAPQRLPEGAMPQLEGTGLEAWMAMGENALGIAIGEDNIDALSEAMKESEADDLFMSGRMNFTVLSTLMEMAEQTLGSDQAPEALAAQRASYEALAEVYEEAGFKVRFGDKGAEMVFEAKLR